MRKQRARETFSIGRVLGSFEILEMHSRGSSDVSYRDACFNVEKRVLIVICHTSRDNSVHRTLASSGSLNGAAVKNEDKSFAYG